MYEALPGPVEPLGSEENPPSPYSLSADVSSLLITDLAPYTNYSITVYAMTEMVDKDGENATRVNQTEEDGTKEY